MRLVNGTNKCQGTLEVFYNGIWGTVCNSGWTINETNVVCKQLECGTAHTQNSVYFGVGTGPILLDDVHCAGNESYLSSCSSKRWGAYSCGIYETVGVICAGEDRIRLVNGNHSCEGRVEVFHNGTWGTVCDDGWDVIDAIQVCQQLGCGTALAKKSNAYFGEGTGPILLDEINCSGDEFNISACRNIGWGNHDCGHNEDAGVICTGICLVSESGACQGRLEIFHNGSWDTVRDDRWDMSEASVVCRQLGCEDRVRLANGNHSCEGRVEVFHNGTWGTVCDDGWDIDDAIQVCQQLNCETALAKTSNAYFGEGTGPILLDEIYCYGDEFNISACSSEGWGNHDCRHNEDAGVICTEEKILKLHIIMNSKVLLNKSDSQMQELIADKIKVMMNQKLPEEVEKEKKEKTIENAIKLPFRIDQFFTVKIRKSDVYMYISI
ncbi:deleted in malignant brain tumors 1 protein-like [Latimeria chalumnae]|uniref:deleted in malignant brain tumors 1 protein-like n=1 Tax=Latimeria chalumnae TaxID=7897 RepID=UPI00313E88DC